MVPVLDARRRGWNATTLLDQTEGWLLLLCLLDIKELISTWEVVAILRHALANITVVFAVMYLASCSLFS